MRTLFASGRIKNWRRESEKLNTAAESGILELHYNLSATSLEPYDALWMGATHATAEAIH